MRKWDGPEIALQNWDGWHVSGHYLHNQYCHAFSFSADLNGEINEKKQNSELDLEKTVSFCTAKFNMAINQVNQVIHYYFQ